MASLEPAVIYSRAVLPSCLMSEPLAAADRQTDSQMDMGTLGAFSLSPLPSAMCLAGPSSHGSL